MPPGKSGNSFWKNKKVLITGYEGFIGSNLVKNLVGTGADIVGLDIKTHRKDTILDGELKRIRIVKGSVEDYAVVSRIINNERIEFVFHLAAAALVGESLTGPLRTFSTNIKGTWNILEACRNSRYIKVIIIASSDKAYGSKNNLPYKEDSSLNGNHPYDVSKSCADLLAYTYFHTYGLAVCVTRCGNIYGPGDFNFSRIVPDAVRSAISGKTLQIRSDGKFTRDYVYVKDIISAYLLLAQKMYSLKIFGQAFNFSNEYPVTVIKLVRLISKLSGRKKADYKILDQAKYEIRHQYLSAHKARKILRWKPEYSLEDGLRETIRWYQSYLLGKY